MEEVKIKDLEPGKDYYIQLVGAFFNKDIHNTGRAIGINFKRTLTFSELRNMPNSDSLDLTVSVDNFKNDDLFAQFEKVVAVNPGTRECGICHYEYYPSISPSWNNLTDERKTYSSGGYQFFKKSKPGILLDSAMRQKSVETARSTQNREIDPTDIMEYARPFIAGKRRRRRRKTKTKRRRKTKTKRRRRKTNTKYSKV